MDGIEDIRDEFFGKAVSLALGNHVGHEFFPSFGLDDGDVVDLLELPHLPGHFHPGTK